MRSNQSKKRMFSLLLLSFAIAMVPRKVSADREGCDPTCCHSSRVASVFEPTQRAIILWNGQEEILFLATELGHREAAPMVEMIALPTEPNAKLGNASVFSEIAILAARKNISLDALISRRPTGKMSNLHTVPVQAWGSASTLSVPIIEFPCPNIASRFSARGFQWLVLDEIMLTDVVQSFPPVEYRFKSNKIFYPLQFSTDNYGETTIDLVVISREKMTKFSETVNLIQHISSFMLSSADLSGFMPEWSSFMGSTQVVVEHIRMVGDIKKMTKDVFAQ